MITRIGSQHGWFPARAASSIARARDEEPALQQQEERERKRREQGAKVFVSRCLCQGTPERRIFDKYIDPLDG